MENVIDTLEKLLDLQETDQKVAIFKKQIKAVPEEKENSQKELASFKTAVEAQKEICKTFDSEIKSIQLDIDKINQEIIKVQSQTAMVKDNNTYRALLKEVENYKESIIKKEDDELVVMEKQEIQKTKLREIEKDLSSSQQRVNGLLNDLDTRLSNCEKQCAILSEERVQKSQDINPKLLKEYNRILASGKFRSSIIAEVKKDGNCGNCHLKLTSQELIDARKCTLVNCKNCGSMIFSRS